MNPNACVTLVPLYKCYLFDIKQTHTQMCTYICTCICIHLFAFNVYMYFCYLCINVFLKEMAYFDAASLLRCYLVNY